MSPPLRSQPVTPSEAVEQRTLRCVVALAVAVAVATVLGFGLAVGGNLFY